MQKLRANLKCIGELAAMGAEALNQRRYKQAIDIHRQLLRQDRRPEWHKGLQEAYVGRAKTLASKGMFKEATIVLENTATSDGTVCEPILYLQCLFRTGQHQKAADHSRRYIGLDLADDGSDRRRLNELAAALALISPPPATASAANAPGATRWVELAAVARQALSAWSSGASLDEVDGVAAKIPLHSPFGSVRLLLKSLCADATRAQRLLVGIPADSPFAALRRAIEATLSGDEMPDAESWRELSPGQRAFVLETIDLPEPASRALSRLIEAEQNCPVALFSHLHRQSHFPRSEVRAACVNLLPQLPERVSQFDKSFAPLSKFERYRIAAISAEGREDWRRVEQFWLRAAAALGDGEDRRAKLSLGVIYRHLARLSRTHPEIEGDGSPIDDPFIHYLERSLAADPECLPTIFELIKSYREADRIKDWSRLANEAARQFPKESSVLLSAMDAAVARKAFKSAAGFARKLLALDPINSGARRKMIELQLAHVRKQMRAKRPNLALKDLAAAAQWELGSTPNPDLRIVRGLVELQANTDEYAEAIVREGVRLAGGGVAGWLRAAAEAVAMLIPQDRIKFIMDELRLARGAPPTKDGVISAVSILGALAARDSRRVIAELAFPLRSWFSRAALLEWTPAEFHPIAELFQRLGQFDILEDYVLRALQRSPDEPTFSFYRMMARVKGDAGRLSVADEDELDDMSSAAAERSDFHLVQRIRRFLDGADVASERGHRSPNKFIVDEIMDESISALLRAMFADLTESLTNFLHRLAKKHGSKAAVEEVMRRYYKSHLHRLVPEQTIRSCFQAIIDEVARDGRIDDPGHERSCHDQ
jgi:tetratricopeptide (TPR) repeat protein